MRVVFVQPKAPSQFWESLGVGYIASFCKKYYNFDAEFFHGNFDSDEEIINGCKYADIVAFSCTTPTYAKGLELARRVKNINPYVKIVFGGWHVTAIKKQDAVVDSIIIGEGELSTLSILMGSRSRLMQGLPLEFEHLPWPDRDFIKQSRTLDLCEKICGERILSFQSRRGCPMNCSFCAEKCMTDGDVRVRDPYDLMNEIEYTFDKYNGTMFKFVDPTWCYPESAAKGFCLEKIKRGNTFPWEGLAHAAFLNKDLLKLMKESGCKQINVGVESGSQRVLNEMRKGITVSKIKKVFKWGKEAGISMRGFFLLGLEKNMEDFELTKKLIKEISPDILGVTILCPYPGSDYYKDEYKNEDWYKCDQYNSFWSTEHFTNEQFIGMQKDIYKEFSDKVVHHQKGKTNE